MKGQAIIAPQHQKTGCAILLLVGIYRAAWAGGFAILEQNASGIGDYHAGGAAIGDDASTSYFNPAALTRLKQAQVDVAATGVGFRSQYSGYAEQNTFDETGAIYPFGQAPFSASGTAPGGTYNLIPALYIAWPQKERLAWGFGINVPFGLSSHWDEQSFVRYSATQSAVKTVNIGPSLGYQVDDHWSWGFSMYAQHAEATFNSVVGAGGSSSFDLLSHNQANGWAVAWNTGVLYEWDHRTRWGIAYQGATRQHLIGKSRLIKAGKNAIVDSQTTGVTLHQTTATSDITFPAIASVSFYHETDEQWAWMGTVYYTRWSVIQTLAMKHVANVIQYNGSVPVDSWSTVDIQTPHHFKNTWILSLGAHYHFKPQWTLLMGAGFDQSPVRTAYRDLRLPDNDRLILALGVQYQPTPTVTWSLGWLHVFMRAAPLRPTNRFEIPVTLDDMDSMVTPGEYALLNGINKASADVVGIQWSWKF